jgi:hypothetical protein
MAVGSAVNVATVPMMQGEPAALGVFVRSVTSPENV